MVEVHLLPTEFASVDNPASTYDGPAVWNTTDASAAATSCWRVNAPTFTSSDSMNMIANRAGELTVLGGPDTSQSLTLRNWIVHPDSPYNTSLFDDPTAKIQGYELFMVRRIVGGNTGITRREYIFDATPLGGLSVGFTNPATDVWTSNYTYWSYTTSLYTQPQFDKLASLNFEIKLVTEFADTAVYAEIACVGIVIQVNVSEPVTSAIASSTYTSDATTLDAVDAQTDTAQISPTTTQASSNPDESVLQQPYTPTTVSDVNAITPVVTLSTAQELQAVPPSDGISTEVMIMIIALTATTCCCYFITAAFVLQQRRKSLTVPDTEANNPVPAARVVRAPSISAKSNYGILTLSEFGAQPLPSVDHAWKDGDGMIMEHNEVNAWPNSPSSSYLEYPTTAKNAQSPFGVGRISAYNQTSLAVENDTLYKVGGYSRENGGIPAGTGEYGRAPILNAAEQPYHRPAPPEAHSAADASHKRHGKSRRNSTSHGGGGGATGQRSRSTSQSRAV